MPAQDRSRLLARARGRYSKAASSRFVHVARVPGNPGRWRSYYVVDPLRRSNIRMVGTHFTSDVAAAQAREAFLDAHPELAAINPRNNVSGRIG